MYSFRKKERLKSKKAIDLLFSEGESFFIDPFQVIQISEPFDSGYPARLLISVSKKKVRKAVTRNLLKRRIREAYRLHKAPFYKSLNQHHRFCSLALIYSTSKIAEYKEIEEKIILILQRLQKENEKDN